LAGRPYLRCAGSYSELAHDHPFDSAESASTADDLMLTATHSDIGIIRGLNASPELRHDLVPSRARQRRSTVRELPSLGMDAVAGNDGDRSKDVELAGQFITDLRTTSGGCLLDVGAG
jgi:hypothetical protein